MNLYVFYILLLYNFIYQVRSQRFKLAVGKLLHCISQNKHVLSQNKLVYLHYI